jgi:hypothetical protein
MSSLFTDAVKEDTFLHRYLQLCADTETPVAYDFTCGVYLLSCAIGRRVRVERPKAPVWLNLYAILCANAGTTRKSSAIRQCEHIFNAAGYGQDFVTVTSHATPESFARELGRQSAAKGSGEASIMVGELVTLLGRERYSMGMPGLLTDLYDCPTERKVTRAADSSFTINNCFVNLLAASTPSWLVRAINPDVVEGGFTSRCLFVVEEQRKRRIAWPEPAQSSDEQLAALVSDLSAIRQHADRLSGRGITLHEAAIRRFVSWYEHRTHDSSDPYTVSFEAREDHHVLRLAGLLSANDGSWMISHHHIGHAIRIISHHKERGSALFGTQAKEGPRLVAAIDRVRTLLLGVGAVGLAQTDMGYKTRYVVNPRELDYILHVMHELFMVQKFEVKTGGKPKIVWRATDKLMVRDLNQLLLDRVTED